MSAIGIAKLFTSVAAVAGISAGSPFLHQWRLDSLTRKSGSGKATETSIQISRGGGNESLSLRNTDVFFKGERAKKTVSLSQVNMTLNGHVVKNGDVLCSPNQKENYVLMRHKGGNKYSVDGMPNDVQGCHMRYFPNFSGLKTFKLEWPDKHLVNLYVDTISLETCNFVFEPKTDSQDWKIILRGCKTKIRNGRQLDDLVLSQANYKLK